MERKHASNRERLIPEMPIVTRLIVTAWIGAMIYVVVHGVRREVNWAPTPALTGFNRS